MAKQRYIKPKFRLDSYIQSISLNQKLLYLYLMTNEHNNIAGVYEITTKTMSFESGYPMDTLLKGIDTLSKDNKIIYIDGWMILVNHVKNQSTLSKTVQEGVRRIISELPTTFKDRVSIGYVGGSIYLDFNLDLNLNTPEKSGADIGAKKKKLPAMNKYSDSFQNFWENFPHARKGKKQEAYKYYTSLDDKKVNDEVKLLRRKIELGLQDGNYVPGCHLWIRDFTPISDIIKQQNINNLVGELMKVKGESRAILAARLENDFGSDRVKGIAKGINKSKITLNFKK